MHTRRGERGAVNYVTILILLAVVGGGYAAWVLLPPYLEYNAVKKYVHTGCNKAYLDRKEETVRKTILDGVKSENIEEQVLAEDGSVMKRPLPFDDRNVQVTLSTEPLSVTATIEWDRHVVWPFLKAERVFHYEFTLTEDLTQVKY